MYADEMKAYIRPGQFYLILGLLLLAFGLWLLPQALGFGILELLGSAILIWVHTIVQSTMKKTIRDLERTGLMLEAISDYPTSKPMARNALRLGSRYLYAKGKGLILDYRDIQKLKLEIKPGKDLQNLFAVCADGVPRLICTMPLSSRAKGDMALLMVTIRAKNPQILI